MLIERMRTENDVYTAIPYNPLPPPTPIPVLQQHLNRRQHHERRGNVGTADAAVKNPWPAHVKVIYVPGPNGSKVAVPIPDVPSDVESDKKSDNGSDDDNDWPWLGRSLGMDGAGDEPDSRDNRRNRLSRPMYEYAGTARVLPSHQPYCHGSYGPPQFPPAPLAGYHGTMPYHPGFAPPPPRYPYPPNIPRRSRKSLQ